MKTPVLHLPDLSVEPADPARPPVRLRYHALCGVRWFQGDVADPGGDEDLADCRRCLRIRAARGAP